MIPSYVDAILRNAAHDPLKPAVGTPSGVLSYGQLAQAVGSAAVRLQAAGLRPGNIAGIAISDPVWHIAVVCALHRIGAISVTIRTDQTDLLEDFDFILSERELEKVPFGQSVVMASDWFSTRFEMTELPYHQFAADDLCRIALSSGTTGQPKPIAMSPEIIWHRLTTYMLRGRFSLSERILCGPQVRSHFAFAITFASLFSGKMVCFSGGANETLAISSYYGIDLAIISVHQLIELIDAQAGQRGGLSSLREIQAGGAKISDQLFGRIRSAIPCPVLNSYASTEAGTVALGEIGQLKAMGGENAVGILAPWATFESCDDRGKPSATGKSGEIRVVTVGMAPPYQSRTQKVVEPAFFVPGDVGYLTDKRIVCIEGRTAELINVGGNKIAPDTLERFVMELDGVKEAAVFALDDDADLPKVCIFVSVNGDFDLGQIYTHMAKRSRVLTPSVVRMVPSLPRNETGKILYSELRQQVVKTGG